MHTGQKYALNLGHVYAPRAKVCPESEARFCTPGRNMPRIWGTFLHPVHKYEPDLGQGFTPLGMACPKSSGRKKATFG